MNKTELRQYYLKKRLSLSDDDRDYLSQRICDNLFNVKEIAEKECFHIFLPITHNKEINTWPIVYRFWEESKKVVVPVTDFKNYQMTNFFLTPKIRCFENQYGIPEPINAEIAPAKCIEVVIMPLLSFDNEGYRVGYGKGFYDKFLGYLKRDVLRVGLSMFAPVAKIEGIGDWDEKMDFCITPHEVHEFL